MRDDAVLRRALPLGRGLGQRPTDRQIFGGAMGAAAPGPQFLGARNFLLLLSNK